MGSKVVEMPPCPRGHTSRSITFGGLYGDPPRQLYKCFPLDGSKMHRFAPVLPRRHLDENRCLECETTIHSHEGPQASREFHWPLRVVAKTLGRVAQGETYVRASELVRPSKGRGGMLAADWTEAFSEDLWTALGPQSWPRFIVADAVTFYIRDWSKRLTKKRPRRSAKLPSKPAYTLLVVSGSDGDPVPFNRWDWNPVVAFVVPGSRVSAAVWANLLLSLPGRPLEVTSDETGAFFNGVLAAWPDDPVTGQARPHFNLCLHHAKTNFAKRAAPASVMVQPHTQAARDLWEAFDRLAGGGLLWEDFEARVRALPAKRPGNHRSYRRIGGIPKHQLIAQQLSRPGPTGPNSNAAAEADIRAFQKLLGGRQASFRNQERTNRLLKLMVLSRRGAFDERTWAATIDEALRERRGRPSTNLRTVSDQLGSPSLR